MRIGLPTNVAVKCADQQVVEIIAFRKNLLVFTFLLIRALNSLLNGALIAALLNSALIAALISAVIRALNPMR